MCTNDSGKTLRQEIAEVIAAEKEAAAREAEEKRLQREKLEEETRRADAARAAAVIATIRDKVLAPDRAQWKSLMTLNESQVFVPSTYSDADILLVDGAAKQVRDFCRDNGIEVKIAPERRDGQYSIRSANGKYVMHIRVS